MRSKGQVEILVTEIDERCVALPVVDVLGAVRMVAVSVLPGASSPVEGVIDLRGEIVAVLDVRARLGLPARAVRLSDVLVIARVGYRTAALHVDRALGVERVDAGQVELTRPPPGLEHVAGVARTGRGLVLIHDLAAFLTWDEGRTLDEALVHARAHP